MELNMRKDVPVELTWDLSLIYPTEEAMLADAKKLEALSADMEKAYKGRLTDPDTINRCLDQLREVEELALIIDKDPHFRYVADIWYLCD